MTPEALAELHALAFTDTPPPWPAAAFAALLGHASTLLATRPAVSPWAGWQGPRPSC